MNNTTQPKAENGFQEPDEEDGKVFKNVALRETMDLLAHRHDRSLRWDDQAGAALNEVMEDFISSSLTFVEQMYDAQDQERTGKEQGTRTSTQHPSVTDMKEFFEEFYNIRLPDQT
ncbi:hypothetical protein KIPB_001763 [Kipferlia bialata]|uniref:Uncharacterized protein n=1 Tax=Kipferlia bialata TaxID=797122 RepID=A0A9K3CR91_9EUKA|nr:hypothetical protein KIPB_001763 [Kipferlia bialata]|eukprot:g1763.t1